MLISRPPFVPVLLAFTGLLVVLAMFIGPSPRTVWAEVDPLGFSKAELRRTRYFSGPLAAHEGPGLEEPARSWRLLALDTGAASTFRELATSPRATTRLWALTGLTMTDSAAASTLYAALANDTTLVSFLVECETVIEVPARRLAALARSPAFAATLRDATPTCVPGIVLPAG